MELNLPVEANALVAGQPLAGRRRGEIRNPADIGQVVGTYPLLDAADIDVAVEAAARAQREWRTVAAADRAALLLKAADRLAAVPGLAELVTLEQGKVAWEAALEVGFMEGVAAFYADTVERIEAGQVAADDGMGRATVFHEPVGVVAGITPWNWPLALSGVKLVPALMAGNAVVIKPAPATPLSVLVGFAAIADLFPTGLISVVTGEDDVVGNRLVEHPLVRMVSFTGSIPTGRKVAARAAGSIKNVTLELGGNDAALILDDAVIDEHLLGNLVSAAFTTTGQVCFAVKRVYAPAAKVAEIAAGIAEILDGYIIGPGLDPESNMGPLTLERQRDRVAGLVEDAAGRGATVRTCGELAADPASGWFLRPVVVTGLDDSAALVAEEQFGPALPVLGYDSVDEAVDRVNASEYGLNSSVWTADEEYGVRLARRLESGTTFVNNHGMFAVDFNAPFGGVKQSGCGRELSTDGLLGYMEPHTVSTRHL